MRRISEGLYVKDDALHFDIPALCAKAGVPYTEKNEQTIIAEALRQFKEGGIPVRDVIRVDEEVT